MSYSNYLKMKKKIKAKEKKIDDSFNDIAPASRGGNKDSWFKSGTFDDGYQFGDVTKAILGTAGDVATGAVKGVGRMVEGIVDLGTYGVAGIADALGADDFADKARKTARYSATDEWTKPATNWLDQYSLLGDKGDAISEGLGQVASIILTGGTAGAVGKTAGLTGKALSVAQTVAVTGATGLSSMGNAMSEAYENGATDEEATAYGLIAGVAEAGTELLFGGIGKAVNAVGISKSAIGLDDALAKKVASKFQNRILKNLAEFGIKAGAEGTEEVLSGIAQAWGKSITYKSDEELIDLIKDEKLLDSFIAGAITSGITQSGVVPGMKNGSLIQANKDKTDFITGYTETEQRVIDKLIEKRLEGMEKSSKKDRANIEEDIITLLEKGAISTEEIEAAVGGESYTAYQDTVSREKTLREQKKALRGEIDRLYKELPEKRDGNRLTEAENELQAVEKSLSEIDLDSLHKKASEDIYNSLKAERGGKGSMLLESYNEVDRSGKKFEVDTSKMDSKRAEIYKRYTDSGILNNTNRTHDFVDMLVALEADRGIKIDVSNNKRLAESGFSVEGATVNGVKTADRLILNLQSAKALNKVLGYEVTHFLEGSEAYSELEKLILEYGKGEIEARTAELKKLYKTDDVQSELVADMVGDYLFGDERFIKSLAQNKNLFQRIFDEIKYLLKIAGKGTKQEKEFARLKRAFEKALSEGKGGNNKTEFSLSNSDGKAVKTLDNSRGNESSKHDTRRYSLGVNSEDSLTENLTNIYNDDLAPIRDDLSTDGVKYSLTKAQLEEEQQRLLDEQRLVDMQLESGDISLEEHDSRLQEMNEEYESLSAQIANVVEATENARKYTKKDAEAFLNDILRGRRVSMKTRQALVDSIYKGMNDARTVDEKRAFAEEYSKVLTERLDNEALIFNPEFELTKEIYTHLREGVGKLKFAQTDLSEIRHKYDKKGSQSFVGRWGYKGNGNTISPDEFVSTIANEVPGMEHLADMPYIEALFEIDKMYSSAKVDVKEKWIREDNSDAELSTEIANTEDAILNAFENSGKPVDAYKAALELIDKKYSNKAKVISEKADALYEEVKSMQKNKKVSDGLGEILDSLGITEENKSESYRQLKYALLNIKNSPLKMLENYPVEKSVRQIVNNLVREDARLEREEAGKIYRAKQSKTKSKEYTDEIREMIGDTSTWKDKKLGILYQVNTLRRNLRDIVKDTKGEPDYKLADKIYDYLQGAYNHHEAELKRESKRIKDEFAKLKINEQESKYIQLLGELKYNPDTTLTETFVNEYYEENKGKINEDKVKKAIEMSRGVYDNLIKRVNEVLREQGMKEIPYRQGYFPHFTKDKQSWLGKLFNWKVKNNDIPTDIAGLTETFEPVRSYQSFNKTRTTDATDYDFLEGFDTYVHGALDWIYHIEDIQKRRAFENELRYSRSEEGVKKRIEEIQNRTDLDADQTQALVDEVYRTAHNPLNNFVTDFRNATNNLAGKKDSQDRALEYATNRRVYSIMTNISNRVTANMVVGSISSAITNFIPITQSWGQVSPISSLRAIRDVVRNAYESDGLLARSDFMTNRLMQEKNLKQSAWDKVDKVAGWLMTIFDKFTTQVVWRSKYIENLKGGMTQEAAIKDADQFAENVMAGRSRGNMPTIFNSKNPLIKMFTAFQLEVANQYGYMFSDMPKDIGTDNMGKLLKGYATMFIGAYVYNALTSALTGRDSAFDPIRILLEDLLKDLGIVGDDDDEREKELDVFGAIEGLTENALKELPLVGGILGGGRIPISSALPYEGEWSEFLNDVEGITGEDSKKYTKSFIKEMTKPLWYIGLPTGGGQLKKSAEGLAMFAPDLPISGSYTDSGNLRYPVEKNFGNVAQAFFFGQYANKNAREYFDNDLAPIRADKIEEFANSGMSYSEYHKAQNKAKIEKNANRNLLSGLVRDYDVLLEEVKDINTGNTATTKRNVVRYLNALDLSYGEKLILYKSRFPSDNKYNNAIINYLNSRDAVSYSQMVNILTELGMTVDEKGKITW